MRNINHKLWIYTFLAILTKCIIFLGFTLNKTHTSTNFGEAYNIVIYHFLPFYCAFAITFLSFAFLFKNRFRLWYLIIINLFISILLLTDLWYFRGFSEMPSLQTLRQASNLNGLSNCIRSLTCGIDIIFIIDVLALILIAVLRKNIYKNVPAQKLTFLLLFVSAFLILLYVPVKVDLLHKDDAMKYYFHMLDTNTTSEGLSPIGYHMVNAFSFVKDSQALKLSVDQENEIKAWFKEKSESIPDNKYKSLFSGKNLILIQVESLEKFVVNQKVNGQEITPNLNRLQNNSLYFSNIHEQVGQGTTSDAELMATTSVFPIKEGSTFFSYPYTTYNSLPKLLESKNYNTLAMHGDEGSFWNWVTAFKSIGFQKCIDSSQLDNSEVIDMGISDGSFLRQSESILTKQKQPFFTFLITLTSHGPFNLPQKYRELTLDPELDKSTLGGYFQSIRYVDKQIGIFIDSLRKDGLLDNTVIIIYGDHEGIHKYYPEDILKVQPSQNWWLENNKEIPLIVYQNKLDGEEIKTIGGQIDILPTISYLMGIDEEKYKNTAMGRNLLKTNKNFTVLHSGEYIGVKNSKSDADNAVKALDIADTIIRSNYFYNENNR